MLLLIYITESFFSHNVIQSGCALLCCLFLLDNAMMENFFGLMKNELLYANDFKSIEESEAELKKCIWR